MRNRLNQKKAFTFAELVVATFISTILMSFLFVYLFDVTDGISSSKTDVLRMSQLHSFINKLNYYRNSYGTGYVLVDSDSGTGSDVFIMKDFSGSGGVLLAPIKIEDYKIDIENLVYEDKGIGFRVLSWDEIELINADLNEIYNFSFHRDQIFSDTHIRDIQFNSYNTGSINELQIYINSNFNRSLIGELLRNLPKNNITQININF